MSSLFLFLIFCHIVCCTFINAWKSGNKRKIRVFWRVLLLRGRIEGIHITSRHWMGRKMTIHHWVIVWSIWRNHSLSKTTERRSRKIYRRRNPEIIHHWCLRIHRRWHPRMISWLRWHLIWWRHHHIWSSIHEISYEMIFSRHHCSCRPYIWTKSRRHHCWRRHVHIGWILIEKLKLFCLLVTAQFFSIFSILWISALFSFVWYLFFDRCRLQISLINWLILS